MNGRRLNSRFLRINIRRTNKTNHFTGSLDFRPLFSLRDFQNRKPQFLVIQSKKGHFGSFWPKWSKRWKLSKKRLEHFSRAYKPYLTVKFHKKLMSGFREKVSRTYGRTRLVRSQWPVGRETKKGEVNLINMIKIPTSNKIYNFVWINQKNYGTKLL